MAVVDVNKARWIEEKREWCVHRYRCVECSRVVQCTQYRLSRVNQATEVDVACDSIGISVMHGMGYGMVVAVAAQQQSKVANAELILSDYGLEHAEQHHILSAYIDCCLCTALVGFG